MIMKRLAAITMILLMLTMQVGAFAEPSDWAVEFVEPAISDGLVPNILRDNYQGNIKRYEYILIALELLEQNNVYVDIVNANPFTDIENHPYKNEIIKAYNANIVDGYEDNTFRPDAEIKREEVAALVYNLVKSINATTTLPATQSAFSDKNTISNWAIPFVEFNYTKSIISGTGKQNGLDTINPLGKTTREQAITLLYKVSKNNSLLGISEYKFVEDGSKTWTSDELSEIGRKIGHQVLLEAIELNDKDDVKLGGLIENSFVLTYTDGSRIEISDLSGTKYISAVFLSLDNISAQEDYMNMISIMFEDQQFENNFVSIIDEMKIDKNYTFNSNLSDDSYVECYYGQFNNLDQYNFLYKR